MPSEETDWSLVDQVQAEEDGAFDAIMARYKRPILNFVFRMIGDATEAQDVAQDVFVRAYRHILNRQVTRRRAFSTWLFQIARHAACDYLRRRKRRPAYPLPLDAETDNPKTVPSDGHTAVEEVIAREIEEQISAAVALLPAGQRTAIILSEYESLSYADIAAIMKCSEKSVETRLYRARQFLRKRLAHLIE